MPAKRGPALGSVNRGAGTSVYLSIGDVAPLARYRQARPATDVWTTRLRVTPATPADWLPRRGTRKYEPNDCESIVVTSAIRNAAAQGSPITYQVRYDKTALSTEASVWAISSWRPGPSRTTASWTGRPSGV